MLVKPLSPHDAPESVQKDYERIQRALHANHVPLFFTYLGSFPEYLTFITNQIVANIEDEHFVTLSKALDEEVYYKTHEVIQPSKELIQWISNNQISPSFYNFQNNLIELHETNSKLAFVFIALRETLKGFAIAAKKH